MTDPTAIEELKPSNAQFNRLTAQQPPMEQLKWLDWVVCPHSVDPRWSLGLPMTASDYPEARMHYDFFWFYNLVPT